MKRPDELIVYRELKNVRVLCKAIDCMTQYCDNGQIDDKSKGEFLSAIHYIIEMADQYGFEGNLWANYITYLLVNCENAYSLTAEMTGETQSSISEIALHDFEIIREWYGFDLQAFEELLGAVVIQELLQYKSCKTNRFKLGTKARKRIADLSIELQNTKSKEEFRTKLADYYKEFGVGKFGFHKAFRIEKADDKTVIVPITNLPHIYLDDLVGYEIAKEKLIANTEAFIEGKKANNCLLYGDAGTGKSTSIKGILNEYAPKGLRIIELYKHQFKDINSVIAQIKNRNYKFILYMDDLSFEEFETDYKYLKAVIEGGLEKKPDNVIIYATSNRRHLVRETFADKEDRREDLHSGDTVQEKLSLAYRFGVTIFFGAPNKKEFQNIVKTLADRYGIVMDEEELLLEANKWELSHGGLSGRCATQFIDYLLGK